MTEIRNIADSTFEQEVIQSNQLVLVDFWAPWCGPCRQLTPIIEEFAQECSKEVKVVKVNVDEAVEVATKVGIRSIPTLMLFKDGKTLDTKIGALQKAALIEWVESYQ